MASGNKFNVFVEDQFEGVHDWDAHTFKWMLTNVAPVATNAIKSELTEIAAGNGYTAGGEATAITTSRTGGVFKADAADVTITATGGTIGPFRYAVLYNDTPTSPADPLIGWYDYLVNLTLADTESFLIDVNPANGVLQAQ